MPRPAFARLLRELARLRAFRNRRRDVVPLRFLFRWYQRRLRRRLMAQWRESYVLLDGGDYHHIPAALDMHRELLLLQPPQFPPILAKFCRPGSTAIDVGANVGQWAVPMAKLVGASGRLLAFEPIPELSDSLRKTFRIGGLRHAEAHCVALSDAAGEAPFYVNASDSEIVDSGVSSLERRLPGSKAIQVRTIALDDFLNERNLPPVSFIKIDVEGHEARVLSGARATLRQHRPALVVETGLETAAQREAIASILRELRYDPIGVLHDRYIAPAGWEGYLEGAPPFESRALNLLLLPSE